MKARLAIAALGAAFAADAARAEQAGPPTSRRDEAAAPGLRVEALAGFDNDGFEQGLLYGGRLGYDFRVGRRMLLGLDGELSDLTSDQEFSFPGLPDLKAEDGPELYVGARATFVLSGRLRLYGGGGYVRSRQGYFFQSDPNPPPFGTIAADRKSFDGFRLGAGAQVLLGRRAFVGAEYRHSYYGGAFALDREQVVGTLGFRF